LLGLQRVQVPALTSVLISSPPLGFCARLQDGKPTTRSAPIKVFVKLHGTNYAELEIPAGASVAALAKAVIAELKLEAGPHQITITLEGATEPLDARKRLAASGVTDGASLVVEVNNVAGACVGSMTRDDQQWQAQHRWQQRRHRQ
jgi:hypothetical protein